MYTYEATLKNNPQLLEDELGIEVKEKAKSLKKSIADKNITDVEALQKSVEEFQQALLAIGSAVYGKAGGSEADREEATSSISPPSESSNLLLDDGEAADENTPLLDDEDTSPQVDEETVPPV